MDLRQNMPKQEDFIQKLSFSSKKLYVQLNID